LKGADDVKKFVVGLIVGILLAITFNVTATSNIKIIINGKEIETDVPPQIIDGRVMVPARFVAEPLGAIIKWDEKRKTINIASGKWERVWPNWKERTGKELMAYLDMKDSTPLEELESGIQKSFIAVDGKIAHLMRIHDRLYILSPD